MEKMLFSSVKLLVFCWFIIGNLSLAAVSSDDEAKPSILSISPEQVKDIGDSVTLNCTVDNLDYSVLWTKKDRDRPINDVVLSIGNQLTMKDPRLSLKINNETNSYLLEISDIQAIDTALYECQIIVSTTNKISSHVELLVKTPPKISEATIAPAPLTEHKEVKITCTADGYPRPSIRWIREYNALMPGGGNVLHENTLVISSANRLDRGMYYCIAENGVGNPVKKSINLEVEFAPIIVTPRPRVAQAFFYDIEMECKVEAYPAPTIVWMRDNKQIFKSQEYQISTTASENGVTSTVLRIHNMQPLHCGDYYCKASNKIGQSEAKIELIDAQFFVYPWKIVKQI